MAKKSKKWIAVIIIACAAAAIFGVMLWQFLSSQITARTSSFELGSVARVSDLYETSGNGVARVSEDALLDTSVAGNFEATVEFKIGGLFSSEETFSYEVQDTIAPTFTVTNQTVILGRDFEPLSAVTDVIDADAENCEISCEGTYDLKVVGEYPITVTVKDGAGNASAKTYTLTVTAHEDLEDGTSREWFYTSKDFLGYTDSLGYTYIEGTLIVNKTYSFPAEFRADCGYEAVHNLSYLDETVIAQFNAMKKAMNAEGLTLWMQSGLRVYQVQYNLYNSYVVNDGKAAADAKSARPGHSEHETGLCFDVNTISGFESQYPEECAWMMEHAWEYGFILRYPKGKTDETGYIYEPWHYRYVGRDLAEKLYNGGDWLTIEDYFGITSEYQD